MNSLIAFTLCLFVAPSTVEISLLNGERHQGAIVEMTAGELSLRTETGAVVKVSVADLLEIRTTQERPKPEVETVPAVRVELIDGSRLRLADLNTTAKQLTGKHALLEAVTAPISSVRSLCFGPANAKLDAAWGQILDKESKKDQLVVQKQEVLDRLEGVVGAIDDATIKFLLDGDEIDVKREKAFGIIYARKPSVAKITAQVELTDGDSLAVKSLATDETGWKLDSPQGISFKLAPEAVARVDFSLGKVVYLSTLEPRAVKYTPFLQVGDDADFIWEYRRDRSLSGKPIRLAQRTYARGLALHSKTELRYRLGGEFRRFQAVMGIDDEITKPQIGLTSVRILGDRRELYAGECRPRQSAVPLDLDVTGVVELEIVVDFGSDQSDIGDRLHLADARVVK